MLNAILSKMNRENILSYFLAFVVIWFGINEIFNPESWVVFLPEFFENFDVVNILVIGHGILLTLCGLALVFNFYRKYIAIILSLILANIIVTLLFSSGLSQIAVRDVGLLGI